MTAQTKEQALDLVAGIFLRAGERAPKVRTTVHTFPDVAGEAQPKREAA